MKNVRGAGNLARALSIALWLVAACCMHAQTPIRVSGSDLIGPEFSKTIYGFAGRAGMTIALAFDGSRPGVDSLKSSRADLALLTLPSEEVDALTGFKSLPLAYHRVVVLVPAAAPLTHLTLEQLARLFGGAEFGPVTRWSDLGVTGEWSQSAPTVIAPEVGVGIALEYFRHAVLRDRALRSGVVRYKQLSELAAHLGADSRAIALAWTDSPVLPGTKALAVAAGRNASPVLPTVENLHDGSYPLQLPLRIVYRAEREAMLSPLLGFLLSDEAATALERAGLVAAPAGVRRSVSRALPEK